MRLSIIIPVLNEAAIIADALVALQILRKSGHEVIVVDGNSDDGTPGLAEKLADQVITASRGRARQMNAGAQVAQGEVLLFLHVDTRLPSGAADFIVAALTGGAGWGWFNVRLAGTHRLLRMIERGMNWRARLTRVVTGDQAIFVRRELFGQIGGYPDIPLMEDIALSKRLKRHARSRCIRTPVITASRRWEQHGMVRTILLMWWLRFAYYCGADPGHLAIRYGLHSR